MDPVQQAFALAQSGDLAGAAKLCRWLIAREPTHSYALFLLGSIEAQQGRLDEAERFLGQAVKTSPKSPDALMSYGRVLLDRKKHAPAIDALSRALIVAPQNAFALTLRGQAFAELGKRAEALADFDRAIALDPRSMPARVNRISILLADKKFSEALTGIDAALQLEPKNAALWHSRGHALHQLKRHADTIASYARAIEMNPNFPDAYLNAANMLMEEERLEEALAWCDKAIALKHGDAPMLLLSANILLHLGRRQQALARYDAAVAAAPDYADAHYHRGSALLLEGRFKEGFEDFEYRWQSADCGFDRPKLAVPEWRGEPLQGKRLIVYSEQGLGDTIQFARFLPMLERAGVKLTFLCHGNLLRLFKPFEREMELIAVSDAARPFDYQSALMSLPLRLGIDLANLPNGVPYLNAEETRVAHWREKIGGHGFKIGIAWQGNPSGRVDRGRSVPLAEFARLAAIPGVRLISLQKKHGLDQLAALPPGMVETLGEFDAGEDAFVDTAAIMNNLDLVVTSDTAIPHLSGALGVPTLLALKAVPDWRWMLDREDCPWYPSLRLFRQMAPGDWTGVFERIANEVRARASAPARSEA